MADHPEFAFLAIKKKGAAGKGAFATGSKEYIDDVVGRWRSGEAPQEETDQVAEPELPPETTQEKTLHDALKKAVAFALAQTHLIEVTNLAPSVFEQASVFFDILEPVRETCPTIEEDEVATVYGLDQDQYLKVEKAQKNLSEFHLGVAALPGATLMSLVASFDALIVDLLAKMLRLDKAWMTKGERNSLTLA